MSANVTMISKTHRMADFGGPFCSAFHQDELFQRVPGKEPSIERKNPIGPSTIGTVAHENPIHCNVWSLGLLPVEVTNTK